jgi:hypothetical protein
MKSDKYYNQLGKMLQELLIMSFYSLTGGKIIVDNEQAGSENV